MQFLFILNNIALSTDLKNMNVAPSSGKIAAAHPSPCLSCSIHMYDEIGVLYNVSMRRTRALPILL